MSPIRLSNDHFHLLNLESFFDILNIRQFQVDRLNEFDVSTLLFPFVFSYLREYQSTYYSDLCSYSTTWRSHFLSNVLIRSETNKIKSTKTMFRIQHLRSFLTSFSSIVRRLSANNISDLISAACFCINNSSHCFFNDAH